MIIFKHNASLNSPYYRFTWPWHAAALTFITSDTWMILLMSHYQIWNHWREKHFTITLHWSRTGSVVECPRISPRNLVTAEHKAQRINTALKYRKMCLTGPFEIMHKWKWNTPFTKDLYEHHTKHTWSHLSVVAKLQSPARIISTCLSSSACQAYKEISHLMLVWVLSKGLILKEASVFSGLLSEKPEESWDKPQHCTQQAHEVALFASAAP